MNIIGIIPARYASTRFPGKPLALIQGRPMILHVCDGASKSKSLDQILVATDDSRIFDVVKSAGYQAVMTPQDCETGSDRVYAAGLSWGQSTGKTPDIVVNIQGDEPLVSPEQLDALVRPLRENSELAMSTLAHEMSWDELDSSNVVKVICTEQKQAIYFSRFAIPYSRGVSPEMKAKSARPVCLRHIGLYGYRWSFLESYCKTAPASLEILEGLEQLRALQMGAQIHVETVTQKSWGVDSPEDILKIEKLLEEKIKAK